MEVIEAEKSIKFDNLIEFIDQALNREFVDMKIKLLCTKLAQRIALLHLPQKVVTWRYNRGKRTLADLENQEDDENMEVCEEKEAKIQQIIVPDIVEDVMDILLRAITDRDIIVRWSAAKGIGRITQRLPSDLAEQILPALLQEAAFAEDAVFIACSYHGICLVLAELARRALIAETELPAVVNFLVDKALEYRAFEIDIRVENLILWYCNILERFLAIFDRFSQILTHFERFVRRTKIQHLLHRKFRPRLRLLRRLGIRQSLRSARHETICG